MNQRIEKIRQLLNELEADTGAVPTSDRDFSAFELPDIIQEIVDDLQPLLEPYDAAFYWFLFRHSIAKDGNPHLRVSTRGLRGTVVRSARSEAADNKISLGKVQETLRALETIGAIRKEGEPNREGTLYRVLIPDEIQACRDFRLERAATEQEFPFPPADADVDYYNVKENRIKVYERDGYICRYCQKQLTRFTATLDHVKPVVEDGDNSLENLVTACLDCNSRKNKRPLGDFLAEK
jgi:hypothetical protein